MDFTAERGNKTDNTVYGVWRWRKNLMSKYLDQTPVKAEDAITLLNDNYYQQGLKCGAIGVVVENLIDAQGIVLVDFFNPLTGKDISVLTKIRKEDFRVLSIHIIFR